MIEAAARALRWGQGLPKGRGAGFALARYKNLAAYCALAVEVAVERESGRVRLVRAQAAVVPARSSTRTASATRSRAESSRR